MLETVTFTAVAQSISENKLAILKSLKWAYHQLHEKRINDASEILLEEIRKGHSSILEADDVYSFVAITERYFRAAQEGAARLNLRLMAKVIANQKLNGNLSADEFLYHADILASLRVNEIILLGKFHVRYKEAQAENLQDFASARIATQNVLKELIPDPFENEKEIMATAHAVTRTGLLLPHPGAVGGPTFEPTVLLEKLISAVNMEEAIDIEKF